VGNFNFENVKGGQYYVVHIGKLKVQINIGLNDGESSGNIKQVVVCQIPYLFDWLK